jgi:membrane protease YdiL (CAAX protease family)
MIIFFTPLESYLPEHVPLEEYIGNTYGELIIFTFFALIAPFVEEIVFRGYIYKGLENCIGSIWAGIVVTIIFILTHGPQLAFSVILLSLISIVSVVLIYIRIKTDNLTNCIIVHLIYNFILVAIMWIVFLTVGFEAKV